MKRVSIFKVDLKKKTVSLPQYINVDFIQDKIDRLNAMMDIKAKEDSTHLASGGNGFSRNRIYFLIFGVW